MTSFLQRKKVVPSRGQRFYDQVRMIQKKGCLSQLLFEEIRRLVESGENNVNARQEEQNQTGAGPIQQMAEGHIAQDEEDERRGEENSELFINYSNIDTVEKQNIL